MSAAQLFFWWPNTPLNVCTNFIRDLDRKSRGGPYHAPFKGFWTIFRPNSMIFYNWHCFDKLHGLWFAQCHCLSPRLRQGLKWLIQIWRAETPPWTLVDMLELILQNGPMWPCHDVDDWWLTFFNHHFDILVHCTVIVVFLLVIKHYVDSSTLIIYKRNCWNILKNEQLLSGPYPAHLFFDWQTVILCWLT